MMSHDDSDWADLASELGLETKPKPKPYSVPVTEQLPFPETPWPQDPNPEATSVESLKDLPDAPSIEDDQDTIIDPMLANEEFASDDESAEGESETEGEGEGDQAGKKKRRRRRRRKGGPGEPNADGSTDAESPESKAVIEPRTMADAIKNLVANWTVPGWNEIVGGLYRPNADRSERTERAERDR